MGKPAGATDRGSPIPELLAQRLAHTEKRELLLVTEVALALCDLRQITSLSLPP